MLLLALKISYPERVWLVRGNHEVRNMNRHYGFETQCCAKLGPILGMRFYELANSVFEWLPLAALVAQSVLVMHGGLGEVECRWTIARRCCKRPRLRTAPPTGLPSRGKEGAAVRKGARFALRCPRPPPLLNAASTVWATVVSVCFGIGAVQCVRSRAGNGTGRFQHRWWMMLAVLRHSRFPVGEG